MNSIVGLWSDKDAEEEADRNYRVRYPLFFNIEHWDNLSQRNNPDPLRRLGENNKDFDPYPAPVPDPVPYPNDVY